MRNLNLEELLEKISEDSTEIEFIEIAHLHSKFTHFWNFIFSQPISKRIIERIDEDFKDLESKILKIDTSFNLYHQSLTLRNNEVTTKELQGAFGYFLLKEEMKKEERYDHDEINLANAWIENRSNIEENKDDFIVYIFKPFVKLVLWYLNESKSYNAQDYFSVIEVKEFSEKLDNLVSEIRLGQEVIFEEIQDLKDQLKNLKKKNWGEILKGKLLDLTLSKVISIDVFKWIVKTTIGEDLKFLE